MHGLQPIDYPTIEFNTIYFFSSFSLVLYSFRFFALRSSSRHFNLLVCRGSAYLSSRRRMSGGEASSLSPDKIR
jgi:hypothetical protein